MDRHITYAFFDDNHYCETTPLYQYDYGQVLTFPTANLPETFEVLFSNGVMHDASTVIGSNNSVAIPDTLLTTGKNVMGWIFLHDTEMDGETDYTIRIPVKPRSKAIPEEFTPEEQSQVTQLVAAIETLRAQVADLEKDILDLQHRMPALGGWKTEDDTSGG